MKKIFNVLLLLICLVGCSNEEINEQSLITEYVKNNHQILQEIVNEINLEEKLNNEKIIEKLPKDINIYNVYIATDNCINFSVDEGTSTRSHYYGFYFSPENNPITIIGMPGEIYEFENGYKKQEEGNEDWYYTEKIADKFFYYEAHF